MWNRLRIDEKIYAFVHSYVGIGFFTLIGMLGFFMCIFVPFMAMDQVRFNNKLKEIEISDKYPEAYAYYEYIHEGKDGSEFCDTNSNTCNCTCDYCSQRSVDND